jgi:putative flippase GtrA
VRSYELPARLPNTPAAGAAAPRGLRALYLRFAHVLHELGKFGIVGAICYGIDFAIFNFAEGALGWNWLPAIVVSTTVSASCAFIGNRYWTWRDASRTALHREYGLFFLFNLVGLAISVVLVWISHEVLGSIWPAFQSQLADNISGKVIGVAFASLFRFWAYRRYVFRTAAPTR